MMGKEISTSCTQKPIQPRRENCFARLSGLEGCHDFFTFFDIIYLSGFSKIRIHCFRADQAKKTGCPSFGCE
jgi:hypothetical protein